MVRLHTANESAKERIAPWCDGDARFSVSNGDGGGARDTGRSPERLDVRRSIYHGTLIFSILISNKARAIKLTTTPRRCELGNTVEVRAGVENGEGGGQCARRGWEPLRTAHSVFTKYLAKGKKQ